MNYPLCSHDLIRWAGDRPVIDADAVKRFAAAMRMRDQAELCGPIWTEHTYSEQAWAQAHDQLNLAQQPREYLERQIEWATSELKAHGLEGAYITGGETRLKLYDDYSRIIDRHRRALRFLESRPAQRSAA